MEPEIFVTTADLGAKRPPPNQRTGLRELLLHPMLLRVVAVIYFLLVFMLWPTIRDEIFYPMNLLSDSSSNWATGLGLGLMVALPFALIVFAEGLNDQRRLTIPFYRNIIFIRNIIQVLFLILFPGTAYSLMQNLTDNFREGQSGLVINFHVLERDYPVAITEGPDFEKEIGWLKDVPVAQDTLQTYLRPGTYTRALMSGLSNTLRAVSIGLVLATILGIFIGIGLLSGNWLVRTVSSIYVEIFRNTPLLVQLFFVYSSIRLVLPTQPRDAHQIPTPLGTVYISARGINYPAILTTDSFPVMGVLAAAGLIGGIYWWRKRLQLQDETGKPANTLLFFSIAFLGMSLLGLALATVFGGFPFELEAPVLGRFNFERNIGGLYTSEFVGLVMALVLYTAAFIADIVRAGIQSVPNGQIEAARASGLTGGQTLRMIVLPQAMRLIIPPMTNQYLNLSKNSSLAISIGFYDLFNVGTIASNQSGQVVVFFVVMMLTYLAMSLIIAFVMNFVNRGLRLKSR